MGKLLWYLSAFLLALLFVSSPSNGDGISTKEIEQINNNLNLASSLASSV